MEYFSILLKENSSDNHNLFIQKLNQGFVINEQIQVGRSTIIILRKR